MWDFAHGVRKRLEAPRMNLEVFHDFRIIFLRLIINVLSILVWAIGLAIPGYGNWGLPQKKSQWHHPFANLANVHGSSGPEASKWRPWRPARAKRRHRKRQSSWRSVGGAGPGSGLEKMVDFSGKTLGKTLGNKNYMGKTMGKNYMKKNNYMGKTHGKKNEMGKKLYGKNNNYIWEKHI